MGSVLSYETRAGKRYRVLYRRPDGSQAQKRGFTTKRSAELYLAGVETSKSAGEYVNPTDAKVTVGELAAPWLHDRQGDLKPSVYRSVESAWRIHVEPQWTNRRVGAILPSEIQSWVSALSRSHSASTVLRVHGVLAGILDVAVRDRRLKQNPARDLKLPKKTRGARAYLSHDQVDALAATARFPTIIYTLAYTGLRWGEATGLRVRHVDFERRRLTVTENAVEVGGRIVVGTTKTGHTRLVPFPEFLAPMLHALARGKQPHDLLLGSGTEHLRRPSSQDGWFAAAVKRARRDDPTFPAISPHDLRHTAASLAISSGANAKVVQRMLGHASAAMTLDTYADLFDGDLDTVSKSLHDARTAAGNARAGVEETNGATD
jgi:integrase